MRRLTAWIYGLLTAALLIYSVGRYREVHLQLRSAQRSLAQLDRAAALLTAENRELAEQIELAAAVSLDSNSEAESAD